ncbi:MAG: LysR family transcriptional regulator [Bdellovibrionota bacterium]
MELNHLRYFYEVAKAGSFTEAARKLHISQSALSKAVALLEESEGVKLLERSKRGVSLTSVGTEVYQRSVGIFQAVVDIQNTCRGTKEVCTGSLNLGASDHVTNYLLVKKLQQMRAAHPTVVTSTFSGTPNEIIAAMLNNEVEFGLFVTPVNVPQIVYEPMFPLEMAIVCHPQLLPKGEGGLTVAKLKAAVREVGFISSIRSGYQNHPSQSLLDLMGKEPIIAFESNSQETQKRLCLEKGGVGFLARFMVEKELKKGTLVEIFPDRPLVLNLLLARRRGLPLSLNARTFIDLVRES